jgi:COP9 signalosome complex subunit 8
MANGPPTPPPTTVTELQDEARENPTVQPPPSSSSTTAPTKQDPYQVVFPAIADLASQYNFQGLIETAEISDLNVSLDCHYQRNGIKKASRAIATVRSHVY